MSEPSHVDDLEMRADESCIRGAKGGVVVNPKNLSSRELERMTRRYATEISIMMGPESDIPAPDIGTNSQVMHGSWTRTPCTGDTRSLRL